MIWGGAGRCVTSSLLAGVVLFSVRVWSQDSVRWATNYYAVAGATPSEVRMAMNRARPWRENIDAMTAWRVEWKYATVKGPAGCRPESITTSTTITMTLPRYVPPTNAEPAIKERGARYFGALVRHELQHGANGLAAAGAVRDRIVATGNRSDCGALDRDVTAGVNATLATHRAKDRELDERTRHGATEGAQFP